MLQVSGKEDFSQLASEIRDCLTDAEFLANCLPDLETAEYDESGSLVCRVRPGLSFVKGTLKVALDIFDERSSDAVRIHVRSKGIGSSALVETAAKLSTIDTGTRLHWSEEVTELGGLLKPASRGLVAQGDRTGLGGVLEPACGLTKGFVLLT